MEQKQIQEALQRIDQVVSGVNMPRNAHIQLTQDLQLVQRCCMEKFATPQEVKDTNADRAKCVESVSFKPAGT